MEEKNLPLKFTIIQSERDGALPPQPPKQFLPRAG